MAKVAEVKVGQPGKGTDYLMYLMRLGDFQVTI